MKRRFWHSNCRHAAQPPSSVCVRERRHIRDGARGDRRRPSGRLRRRRGLEARGRRRHADPRGRGSARLPPLGTARHRRRAAARRRDRDLGLARARRSSQPGPRGRSPADPRRGRLSAFARTGRGVPAAPVHHRRSRRPAFRPRPPQRPRAAAERDPLRRDPDRQGRTAGPPRRDARADQVQSVRDRPAADDGRPPHGPHSRPGGGRSVPAARRRRGDRRSRPAAPRARWNPTRSCSIGRTPTSRRGCARAASATPTRCAMPTASSGETTCPACWPASTPSMSPRR